MTVEKGVANFKGFFISYLEMLRFVAGTDYAENTSTAIARLCTEVLGQAQKIFNDLPEHEREAVRQIDLHPDALVTYAALARTGKLMRKTTELDQDRAALAKQLNAIRSSLPYKTARSLKRLFKPNR
jgi:hypothetical protein